MRRRGPDILDELLDVLEEEETANAALIKKIREGEWAGPAVSCAGINGRGPSVPYLPVEK